MSVPAGVENKVYLGDAVYAFHDNFHIWLQTENGISVTNRIALEPAVFAQLLKYRDRVYESDAGGPNAQS